MLNVAFEWGLDHVDWYNDDNIRAQVRTACLRNGVLLLEIVEYLVEHTSDDDDLAALERLFLTAHSIWTVRDGALGYRVDPTVQARADAAIEAADQGPSHWLAEAWNDAYSRTPRPGPSYDASIKAVEGALRGIVIPNNHRATITQIINALRDGRSNFEFALGDARGMAAGANEPVIDTIDTVLQMLRTLAYGQKTRHGESGAVTINDANEARAAVQLATTLVDFGTNGSLRRK
ncbi:hypothetical protein [Nocardioides ultimimeridianus]